MTPRRVVSVGLGLVVVGIVVGVAFDPVALKAVGLTLAGVGAVLLVAAAFLAVGLAEDRERDRAGGPGSRQ